MTFTWNAEAEEEFSDAADYYDRQDDGLGDRFVAHIQVVLARIQSNPFMVRCFDDECPKVKADKFPYLVIYQIEGEKIQIISVMHTSRDPGYWKSRIKG